MPTAEEMTVPVKVDVDAEGLKQLEQLVQRAERAQESLNALAESTEGERDKDEKLDAIYEYVQSGKAETESELSSAKEENESLRAQLAEMSALNNQLVEQIETLTGEETEE